METLNMNTKREREFIRLLSLGVIPTVAAKEAGYFGCSAYRLAIKRMACRDIKRATEEARANA